MNTNENCLNCATNIVGKYCYNCGQKSDTHRITFKHFIYHDVLHGVWHIEKGILFTAKSALFRPGKAALEYIEGKRIKYYNVFYLILILLGLIIVLSDLFDKYYFEYFNIKESQLNINSKNSEVDKLFTDYSKLLLFSLVPVFSLNSKLIFKKLKLNFSEHLVVSGIVLLGIVIITFIGALLNFLEFIFPYYIFDNLNILTPIIILFYIGIAYNQVIENSYSKSKSILLISFFIITLLIEIIAFIKTIKFLLFN